MILLLWFALQESGPRFEILPLGATSPADFEMVEGQQQHFLRRRFWLQGIVARRLARL
jgi:hypothetical protein